MFLENSCLPGHNCIDKETCTPLLPIYKYIIPPQKNSSPNVHGIVVEVTATVKNYRFHTRKGQWISSLSQEQHSG